VAFAATIEEVREVRYVRPEAEPKGPERVSGEAMLIDLGK